MSNTVIRSVIVLGAIAIAGIIGMQAYWVINTWNINEKEFNKKVNLALYNVATSLAEFNQSKLPPRNIIYQRTTNYYVVNIEDEIDANMLEFFLQKELESLALNVDFEYGVFDCTTDEMVYGNFIRYSADPPRQNVELGNLPKYEDFTYYFGVKFPTRSGYLFGKMQLSVFLSSLLLITLTFFSYALYVILRQKRLSEMQKDFINNMTHEFKTPLSTIKISTEVILKDPLIKSNARLSQYASIIRDQNIRLNEQVEKVLQLAKIEKGNFQVKPEKIHLISLLEPIVESTLVQVEKKEGRLSTDLVAADLDVVADPFHLNNILQNLLDNAVKYCRQSPEIAILAKRENSFLQLTIKDNGIGINQEYQHRIFDKFFRVPTGNVHNVKGFGLGLYYVKKICDAHAWRIHLESGSGQGTMITITMAV